MSNVNEIVGTWAKMVETSPIRLGQLIADFEGTDLADDIIETITERRAKVQLLFRRSGLYSFGGFAHNADVEGNAGTSPNSRDIPANSEGNLNDKSYIPENKNADGDFMVIPVNPENITVTTGVNSKNYETSFHAELAVMSGLKLRTFTIESFFPAKPNEFQNLGTGTVFKPVEYVNWIMGCMKSKCVLRFFPFGNADVLPEMDCFFTSFVYTLQPNGDVTYTLEVCEFIDYRKDITSRRLKLTPRGAFVVSDDSRKREVLNDQIIRVGDYITVKPDAKVYSDQYARTKLTLGDIIGTPLQHSPTFSLNSLLAVREGKDGNAEWVDPYNNGYKQYGQDQMNAVMSQYGNFNAVGYYLGFTDDIIGIIKDLVKSPSSRPNEIWKVINYYKPAMGSDYAKETEESLLDGLYNLRFTWLDTVLRDIRNLTFKDMSQLELQIKSMQTGKTGWIKTSSAIKITAATARQALDKQLSGASYYDEMTTTYKEMYGNGAK